MNNSNFVFKYPPPPPLPVYQPPPPPPPSAKQSTPPPLPPPMSSSSASWSTNFNFSCPPPTLDPSSRNQENVYQQAYKYQGSNNQTYGFNTDKSSDYADYIRRYYSNNRFRPPNPPSSNMGWNSGPYPRKLRNDCRSDQRNENSHGENGCFTRFKKRKRPMAKAAPARRTWTEQEAEMAIEVEKEFNKKFRSHSLRILFPDQELNREIVSKFNPAIETVYFQQPSSPRFCYVTLSDGADPLTVMEELNKIQFGLGYLSVEYKKEREDEQNMGPEAIDPLTLYVGNLAQEVTKEDMVKKYPKNRRIDIGFAKRMKFTRYAFVNFRTVEDAIEAFKETHYANLHSKSLIVRFRRLHGTVGMPGEPKIQNQRKDGNTGREQANGPCMESDEGRDTRIAKEVQRLTINSPHSHHRAKRLCNDYSHSSSDVSFVKSEPYDYLDDEEEYQWDNDDRYAIDGEENRGPAFINSKPEPLPPNIDSHTALKERNGFLRDSSETSNEVGLNAQNQSSNRNNRIGTDNSIGAPFVAGSSKNPSDLMSQDRSADSSLKIPAGNAGPQQFFNSSLSESNRREFENDTNSTLNNENTQFKGKQTNEPLPFLMIQPKVEWKDESYDCSEDSQQKSNNNDDNSTNALMEPKKEIEYDSFDSDMDDPDEFCNASTDFHSVLDNLKKRSSFLP